MKYQTDFVTPIREDGCLLCSLVTLAEIKLQSSISNNLFLRFVDYLFKEAKCSYDNRIPVISDENDPHLFGAYVQSHADVVNEYMKFVKKEMYTFKYVGRQWMGYMIDKGYRNFGTQEADDIILHVMTPYGGHFRLPNFDPYVPNLKVINVKSVRYYKWEAR